LLLNGDLKELARLTAATAAFCREHALDDDVEFDLNLATEELFTNTLNHGHCQGGDAIAEVVFTMQPGGVAVEYADRGEPFNPLDAPVPDISAPLGQRPDGGLGVHLVRQIMRDFEYQRAAGWNRLRMRRPIPGGSTP
jgi:anti-sigma regulatory factor (Ser/Thr protein kinase)